MLVVADDLTGAADSAGTFAAAGHRCTVSLSLSDVEATVLAIDTHSRAMSEGDAFMATAAAVSAHPGRPLFLKIDSTLRGHVRVYVEAALSAMTTKPERVVVCPAFPARGRTLVDGAILVDGDPPEIISVREAFAGFAGHVGLFIPTIRRDEDLAGVVSVMRDSNVLWVGSAGIARHLAAKLALTSGPIEPRLRAASIAVAVGSQQPATIAQLGSLGGDVVVHRIDPRQPEMVAALAEPLATVDGLILTGGHTARAVLELLQIDRFEVGGEVEPGVPWSRTARDGRPLTIVTKAGGFGGPSTLRDIVDFLASAP
ncbi:MAG TPA: four-carbon acid sugar kinase family protein [Ilumatobacteraceae bacterium]